MADENMLELGLIISRIACAVDDDSFQKIKNNLALLQKKCEEIVTKEKEDEKL